MISDILADAVDEIELYQQQYQTTYAQFVEEIEAVKRAMTALRERLDALPSEGDPSGTTTN